MVDNVPGSSEIPVAALNGGICVAILDLPTVRAFVLPFDRKGRYRCCDVVAAIVVRRPTVGYAEKEIPGRRYTESIRHDNNKKEGLSYLCCPCCIMIMLTTVMTGLVIVVCDAFLMRIE